MLWYGCLGIIVILFATCVVKAADGGPAAEPEDTRTLTVAVVQFAITKDVDANLAKMLAFIKQASEKQADLVLFSECCLSGYAGLEIKSTDEIDREALARAETAIRNAAGETGLYVVFGTTTFRDEGKPFNSLVMVDDAGAERARYHKVFVSPGDLQNYTGGTELVLQEVKGVKVALSICYDFRFPELYRWQAEQGAEVMLIAFHQCTEWGHPVLEEIAPAHLASRAAENNCFVVASNKGAPKQWFNSRIYRPNGTLLAEAPRDVEYMLVQRLEMKDRNQWNANIRDWGLKAFRRSEVPSGTMRQPEARPGQATSRQ